MIVFRYFLLITLFFAILDAKPLEKVSLQLKWLDQFQFAGYYIAKEKGFYKDVGLDVTLKPYSTDINVVDDVVNGISTYGLGRSSLIIEKLNNKPIRLLFATLQASPFVLIAREDSGIKKVSDFKNKKIMVVPDNLTIPSFYAMLYKFKLSEKDFIRVDHSFNIDDLIDRKIDLMGSYISNEPYLLKQRGVKIKIFNPSDYGFDFYNDIAFTSEYEITHHPQRTVNFINASIKGWEYAFSHIEETVELIMKKYNSQHKTKDALFYEAKVLKKLAYSDIDSFGTITKTKLQRIVDIYNILGLTLKHDIPDDVLFDYKNVYNQLNNEELNYIKNKKTLTVCAKKGWLPYETIDQHGNFIGMSADFLKLYSNKLNLELEIIPSDNQTDSLKLLMAKKCDIKPLLVTKKLKTVPYNPTKAYFHDQISLVTRLEQGYINNLDNVKQSVLVTKGFKRFKLYLLDKYPNIKLIEVKDTKTALQMVANGDAFGYIGTSLASSYVIQKYFSTRLKIINSFKDISFGFGVVEDDKILKNILNKLIVTTTRREKNDIFNKWIVTTVEKQSDYTVVWRIFGFLLLVIGIIIYKNFLVAKHNKELKLSIKEALEKEKEKDKQLVAQSRLAQMGEMISMIAHQWRQPLTAISSVNISLSIAAQMDNLDKQAVLEQTDSIDRYLQHLTTTIDDFRDFFKPTQKKTETTFNNIIDDTLNIIGVSIVNNNIRLIKELDSIEVFETYPNDLKQVLLNLLKNSKDALVDQKIDDKYIKIETKGKKLIVSDNAGGIPTKIIEKIFDPYFTTKDEKNGTGLGLYMSKMIIEEHCGGVLNVKNGIDGAIFTIDLDPKR